MGFLPAAGFSGLSPPGGWENLRIDQPPEAKAARPASAGQRITLTGGVRGAVRGAVDHGEK